MNEGDLAVEKKDDAGALKAYGAAEALVPDNAEMAYWHAVALVNMGRVDEALPVFAKAFRLHPKWRDADSAPSEGRASSRRPEAHRPHRRREGVKSRISSRSHEEHP